MSSLKVLFSAKCIYGKWSYDIENTVAINLNDLNTTVGPFSVNGTHPIIMHYVNALVEQIVTLNVSVRLNSN